MNGSIRMPNNIWLNHVCWSFHWRASERGVNILLFEKSVMLPWSHLFYQPIFVHFSYFLCFIPWSFLLPDYRFAGRSTCVWEFTREKWFVALSAPGASNSTFGQMMSLWLMKWNPVVKRAKCTFRRLRMDSWKIFTRFQTENQSKVIKSLVFLACGVVFWCAFTGLGSKTWFFKSTCYRKCAKCSSANSRFQFLCCTLILHRRILAIDCGLKDALIVHPWNIWRYPATFCYQVCPILTHPWDWQTNAFLTWSFFGAFRKLISLHF